MTEWEKLREPFPDEDLEWRILKASKDPQKPWAIIVPYIQSRAVMDRLDEVFGPDGWEDPASSSSSTPHPGIQTRARIGETGPTRDV